MATPDPAIRCADALEALEIAAVEPRGLATLAEAATPGDAAVVAHLADCAGCAGEAERLRDIATILRVGLAPAPSPELRGRALAYVAAVGRPRGRPAIEQSADAPMAARPGGALAADRPIGEPGAAGSSRAKRITFQGGGRRLVLAGLTMAAIVVLAVGASAFVATGVVRSELVAERERSTALARTSDVAMRILADPAAIRIPMAGAGGASGVAVVSPAAYVGAVVATGMPEVRPGYEYVCYVVVDGERRLVGRMAESGSTYAWTGSLGAFPDVRPGSVGEYGVLLVPQGSDAMDGAPVIAGSL